MVEKERIRRWALTLEAQLISQIDSHYVSRYITPFILCTSGVLLCLSGRKILTRSLLTWHTGSYLPLQARGRYGPNSALHRSCSLSFACSAFWIRICLSLWRRRFLILHGIPDILLDDHLVALRATCDAAAVAIAVMPRSSLVVILAVGDNLD